MAYAIVHYFPGGTREQYEAELSAVHPAPDVLPDGQIVHIAGSAAEGWTIVAVHESKESWERFRDGKLLPTFKEGVKGGFTVMPQEIAFEVFALHR